MTSKCGNLKKSGTQGAAKFVSDVHTTFWCLLLLNPFTPTSDQDRISPYNIKQEGDENRKEYQSWDY